MTGELTQRRSIRWQGYDYAQQGAYYLTICTDDRHNWFGRIADGVMHPSAIGQLAQRCWDAIPEHMPHVDIGEFVVMPNHVHGIVVIRERVSDVRGVVRGGVLDVGARHDAPGIGAMHAPGIGAMDAPGIGSMHAPGIGAMDAPGIPRNAPDMGTGAAPGHAYDTPGIGNNAPEIAPDDPGNGMPGDDRYVNARARHDDDANAHGPHTRARHAAPLRDPRKPPGIPRGALGQVVASYKSAITRIAYRDGLVPHGTPVWQRNYWDRVIRDDDEYEPAYRQAGASRNTSPITPPIGGRIG